MHIGAGIGRKSLAIGMETANTATPPTLAMTLTDNGPVMSQAALALSAIATISVATATTVAMVVTLDSSLTFVSAAGSGWTCGAVGQVVTCTRASAVVGAAPTVTINVTSGSATKTTSNTGTLNSTGATQATATDAASVKLVSKDATSGKRQPQSATEWTNLMSIAGLAGGNPAFLWKCQESSGDLADSIGACTLTAANAPSYANAVSGWTSKAVGWTAGGTANFTNTTTPPNGNASSLALLCYQYVSAGAASYREMAAMTTFAISMALDASSHINVFDNAVTPGTENIVDGVVRPFLIVYNRAATTCFLYTGVDKLDGSYASSAGVSTTLGAAFFTNPTGGCVYATQFTGAAAEFSAAQAKTLLQTLGWTVSWS